MRNMLLTSVAALGLAFAAPALAQNTGAAPGMGEPGMGNATGPNEAMTTAPAPTGQEQATRPPRGLMREGAMNPSTGARYGHVPGEGVSLPRSGHASNTSPSNTRSVIAPSLPVPPLGPNATPEQFLNAAKHALQMHRTGEAQEALERAMTRRLERNAARGVSTNDDPMIGQIRSALDALGHRDIAAADQQISGAMSVGPTAGNAMPMGGEMSTGNPGMPPHQTSGTYQGGTPSGNPYRTSEPGTLGTEVSPPGTQMNPTGQPQ